MGKLDSLNESKILKAVQAWGNKFSSNFVVASISKSMMGIVGILMVGAFFNIICSIMSTIVSVGGYTTGKIYEAVYNFCQLPYQATMGIISIYLVTVLTYNYSKALKLNVLQNAISSLAVFLTVAIKIVPITQEGRTTNYIDFTYFGTAGLFSAMIIGILSVRISYFCMRKNIRIKLPDSVPAYLSDSFTTIIPIVFNVLIWHGINTIISIITGGQMNLPLLITVLVGIPFGVAVNSVPGIIILGAAVMIFWFLGIHGTMVAFTIIMAPLINAYAGAAAVVANAGGNPAVLNFAEHFQPVFLFVATATAGGTGNVLSFLVLGLVIGKSQQMKAISKAGIIPAIFGISEPAVFGIPIMYNPLVAIPFILNVPINMFVFYLLFRIDFFHIPYNFIMSTLPLGVNEVLSSLSWHNAFMPVVAFIISGLCYLPFFILYDRQLHMKEMEATESITSM